MTKTVNFGKVDGYDNGRRTCAVDVEFGFREFEGQEPYFTACASVWNNLHTDIIWGGQCVDEISKWLSVRNHPLYANIRKMWELYHLKKYSEIPETDRVFIEKMIEEA